MNMILLLACWSFQSADSVLSNQWVPYKEILYTSSSAPVPNPFSDSIKVHEQIFLKYAQAEIDSGAICVLPEERLPILWAVNENGDSLSVREFFLALNPDFPRTLLLVLGCELDWDGTIRSLEVRGYRGVGIHGFKVTNIRKFVRGLRAVPYKKFGFPTGPIWLAIPMRAG